MAFKYAYENLMKYRKRLEEVAMRDFLAARHAYDDSVKTLEQMLESIRQTRELTAEKQAEGGSSAEALKQMDEFIYGQLIRIERHKETVRQLLVEVESKQAILTKAAQEFNILEKLKEKLKARYKDHMKKKELKEVDEMVVMKFRPGGQDI